MSKKAMIAFAAITIIASPALAQNRWMDQAKENAARREENKAVREAEHPDDAAKPAAATTAAAPAPAPTTTAAAAPAPAPAAPAPAAPATAEAAPAPAPAALPAAH